MIFQESFKNVSSSSKGALRVFERSLTSVLGKFLWCYKGVSRKFVGCFKKGSRVVQESFKGV